MSVSAMAPVSDGLFRKAYEFLAQEALLLDEFRLDEWLALLTPDISYRLTAPDVPFSSGRGPSRPRDVLLLNEDLGSLKARVKQASTPAMNVAENPPTISRRFVSNILVQSSDLDAGVLVVRSNVLVYRARLRETEPHLFSMMRVDTMAPNGEELRLRKREARLDAAVIGARNISLLF